MSGVESQRRYVAKKRAKGECIVGACREHSGEAVRCKRHAELHVDNVRAYRAAKKEAVECK